MMGKSAAVTKHQDFHVGPTVHTRLLMIFVCVRKFALIET